VYALNAYVRARSRTGFAFKATVAGESGLVEPNWPTAAARTVADGSVTWASEAPGTSAVDTISTSTWSEVGSSALTFSGTGATAEDTTVTVAGGVAGQVYRVRNQIVTNSGKTYQAEFSLEVK
jgi:hypothetical protein